MTAGKFALHRIAFCSLALLAACEDHRKTAPAEASPRELARAMFASLAEQVVEADRDPPSNEASLRLITRSRPSEYPGLCAAQFLDLTFDEFRADPLKADRLDRVDAIRVFKVVGDLDPTIPKAGLDAEARQMAKACSRVGLIRTFYPASDSQAAYVAARAVNRMAAAARTAGPLSFPLTCAGEGDCRRARTFLAGAGHGAITNVERDPAHLGRDLHLHIKLAKPGPAGKVGSWSLRTAIKHDSRRSDVVTYYDYEIVSVVAAESYSPDELGIPPPR